MCISKIVLIIIGFAVLKSYSDQWEVFTNKNDVLDIALAGNTLWAATTGGVVAWNLLDNSYKRYTTVDGLLSCNINQVAIDKNGQPWVATKEPSGLFVYENQTWKQMNVNSAENEFADKYIAGLEVDQFGNVWIDTRPIGGWYASLIPSMSMYLWRYDGQTWHKYEDVFGPLALDLQKNLLAVDSKITYSSAGIKEGYTILSFRIVSFNGTEFVGKWLSKVYDKVENHYISLEHIAQDSKGNAWISYFGERTGSTYGIVCNNTRYTTLDGLADNNVRSITADESGTVWCATDGGISKFTGTSWVSYDTTKGVASNLVYKILIDSNNTLYAATSKGISILKSSQWKILKTINEPSHNNYTDMVVDKRDAVILSGGDHIAIYNDLQWKTNYFQDIRIGDSEYHHFPVFKYNNNKTFIKSEDGTFYAIGNEIEKGWILKQGAGGSTFVKVFSYTLEKHNRFQSPAVICSSNDESFWLTGARGNLILCNKKTATIFPPSRFGVHFGIYKITYMLLDRDGRSVWIGYKKKYNDHGLATGIVHFDGDIVKNWITKNNGLTSNCIIAIARDSSKNLWFASLKVRDQMGLITVLRNKKLANYLYNITNYHKDRDGKIFGSCNALFVDNKGNVWTHADSGIARYSGSSWKLFERAEVSPFLPYERYSHIIQDKSGTVWFGTEGSGLLAYKDNRWYQLTTRNGIPNNSIRSCALDSKDNLWFLTDNGIAMRKADCMVPNQAQRDFLNPGKKRKIKQSGNRFYVSSNKKPNMIQYTLFDLRGRVVLSQTIHRRKSFVLPEKLICSGIRVLSITIEDTDGYQDIYLLKMSGVK